MDKILHPISAEELISQSAEAIDAVKTASGFQDQHFKTLCMPLIKAFANAVQMVPLSTTYYRDVRGAWDFGLVSAMVAFRYAGTQIFYPTMESEERRIMEPQCRFAAFAATLGSAVALTAQNTRLTVNRDGVTDEYHPVMTSESMRGWLQNNPTATFSWRAAATPLTPQECAAISARFFPAGLLSPFDLRVVLMIYNSISPQLAANGIETTLSKVVRNSISKVIEKYMLDDAKKYRDNPSGAPITVNGLELGDAMVNATIYKPDENPLDGKSPATTAPVVARTAGDSASDVVRRNTLMSNASDTLTEWFQVLQTHDNYQELKSRLKVTEEGIEVPLGMLGLFGVSAPLIRKHMTDANMVVGRTSDQRGIVVDGSLKPLFFGEEE